MLGFLTITPGRLTVSGGEGSTKRLIFAPTVERSIPLRKIVCVEPYNSHRDAVNHAEFCIVRWDYSQSSAAPESHVVNESRDAILARCKLTHHSWTAYLPPADREDG